MRRNGPSELHTKWQAIANQLPLIKELTIPRHVVLPNNVEIQIHGFCDVSQSGYGACLYVRSCRTKGHGLVRLACAKSRLAPVKQLTIPRLELCGATLLTDGDDEDGPFFLLFFSCVSRELK